MADNQKSRSYNKKTNQDTQNNNYSTNNDRNNNQHNPNSGNNNNNNNYRQRQFFPKNSIRNRQYQNKKRNVYKNDNEKQFIPIFTKIANIDVKSRSAFFVAEFVSIEQVDFVAQNQEKLFYKLVTLKDFQDSNPTTVAQIKLYPGKAQFLNDIEEKKKAEHYEFFSKLEIGQPLKIYNAKVKKNNNKHAPTSENKESEQVTPKYSEIKQIGLNEWSQVKLLENDVTPLEKISANNKFVNILALITHVEPLIDITSKQALSTPSTSDPALTKHYKITFRDEKGEMFCILPNLEKFQDFIQIGKYLYLEKAQIKFSINQDERQIYLSIYIQNDEKKITKGFIQDLTNFPPYKQTIENIKAKNGLINISNKIWIVKAE